MSSNLEVLELLHVSSYSSSHLEIPLEDSPKLPKLTKLTIIVEIDPFYFPNLLEIINKIPSIINLTFVETGDHQFCRRYMYAIVKTVISRGLYVIIRPSFFPCDVEQMFIYRNNDDIQNLAPNSCFKLTVHPGCLYEMDFDCLKQNISDSVVLFLLKDI